MSMDTVRASPCGSPCNSLQSRMLQPICKFRSGQGSNPEARAPIPLDQINLVPYTYLSAYSQIFLNLCSYINDPSWLISIKDYPRGELIILKSIQNHTPYEPKVVEVNISLFYRWSKNMHIWCIIRCLRNQKQLKRGKHS